MNARSFVDLLTPQLQKLVSGKLRGHYLNRGTRWQAYIEDLSGSGYYIYHIGSGRTVPRTLEKILTLDFNTRVVVWTNTKFQVWYVDDVINLHEIKVLAAEISVFLKEHINSDFYLRELREIEMVLVKL